MIAAAIPAAMQLFSSGSGSGSGSMGLPTNTSKSGDISNNQKFAAGDINFGTGVLGSITGTSSTGTIIIVAIIALLVFIYILRK